MDEEFAQLVKVDDKQLHEMVKYRWCDLETPLIAIPIDFKSKPKDSNSSGFLLFTKGAIYIFNKKVFGLLEFNRKLHLLDVKYFTVKPNIIELEFHDGSNFDLKTNLAQQVSQIMVRTFNELTFGVTGEFSKSFFEIFLLDVELNGVTVTTRPKHSLKWRALFLSHWYNVRGEFLHTITYFDKFEDSDKKYIIIGPSLHPGISAAAFGHAIAWETSVSQLVLNHFYPSRFPNFLDAIIQNSVTITKVYLSDYHNIRKLHMINDTPYDALINEKLFVTKNRIKEWYFMRNDPDFMITWAEMMKNKPKGSEAILINNTKMNSHEFTKFIQKVTEMRLVNTIKKLFIASLDVRPFPIDAFKILIDNLPKLEFLSLCKLDVDATQIFKALFQTNDCNIKKLFITRMQFRSSNGQNINQNANKKGQSRNDETPIPLFLPNSLIHVNVSGCWFTPSSMRFLLHFVTQSPLTVPIFFEANKIFVRKNVYSLLSKLNFDSCYPNICEINWSNNNLPSDDSRFFFAFLFTQKRLRFLTMQKVVAEDPTQFLQFVMQLITSLKLPAIDIYGNFDKNVFLQFIQALGNAHFIRRIGLSNSMLGDEGLHAFLEVIKALPQINEIIADDFKPTNQQIFFEFWKNVTSHKSIKSCNYPTNDLKHLGLSQVNQFTKLPSEDITVLKKISEMPMASTTVQRVEYMINLIKDHKIDENHDVFIKAKNEVIMNDSSYDDFEITSNHKNEIENDSKLNAYNTDDIHSKNNINQNNLNDCNGMNIPNYNSLKNLENSNDGVSSRVENNKGNGIVSNKERNSKIINDDYEFVYFYEEEEEEDGAIVFNE